MNINWFQTYIYEQILFIFPILLRCLQFLPPCSVAVHLQLQTAEVVVLSLDGM